MSNEAAERLRGLWGMGPARVSLLDEALRTERWMVVKQAIEAAVMAINGAPGMYVSDYEGSMVGRTHAINVAEDAIRAILDEIGSAR